MSGKRWTVDENAGGWPEWPGGTVMLTIGRYGGSTLAEAQEARVQVAATFRDAARLRSLAATFDNRLNRDQSFTGAEVAAMLRDGGE